MGRGSARTPLKPDKLVWSAALPRMGISRVVRDVRATIRQHVFVQAGRRWQASGLCAPVRG